MWQSTCSFSIHLSDLTQWKSSSSFSGFASWSPPTSPPWRHLILSSVPATVYFIVITNLMLVFLGKKVNLLKNCAYITETKQNGVWWNGDIWAPFSEAFTFSLCVHSRSPKSQDKEKRGERLLSPTWSPCRCAVWMPGPEQSWKWAFGGWACCSGGPALGVPSPSLSF